MNDASGIDQRMLAFLAGCAALFGAIIQALLSWPKRGSWPVFIGAFLGHIGGGFLVGLFAWESLAREHPTYFLGLVGLGGFSGMLILVRLQQRWLMPALDKLLGAEVSHDRE